MRAWLYNQLRGRTSQESRNRLKAAIHRARQRARLLYVLRHGTFDADDVVRQIGSAIGSDFEILMVHASYNDLLPCYSGTAGDLLSALLGFCGPNRTLAMPAFFFGGADQDVASYYRRNPRFDARKLPSQMGLLSELFRRRKGVVRSLHPTHSVCALGPLAQMLTQGHHLSDTTFGTGTPFGVMASRETRIAGVGTRYFRCLTQVHTAEDFLGGEFPLERRAETIPVRIVDANERSFAYSLKVEMPRPRRVERLRRWLRDDELREWTFRGVPVFATSARAVTDALMAAARRGETIYER
jgi:aminoglycoside 3-N-acetyltransferase